MRPLEKGELKDLEGVPVRVRDQCLTSEVLGSLRCDCKQQLELALDYIIEHGGCIIYMQQVTIKPANRTLMVPEFVTPLALLVCECVICSLDFLVLSSGFCLENDRS